MKLDPYLTPYNHTEALLQLLQSYKPKANFATLKETVVLSWGMARFLKKKKKSSYVKD